jgi:hypothetical protein
MWSGVVSLGGTIFYVSVCLGLVVIGFFFWLGIVVSYPVSRMFKRGKSSGGGWAGFKRKGQASDSDVRGGQDKKEGLGA